jgi:hypothetical protein
MSNYIAEHGLDGAHDEVLVNAQGAIKKAEGDCN